MPISKNEIVAELAAIENELNLIALTTKRRKTSQDFINDTNLLLAKEKIGTLKIRLKGK